MLLLLAFFFGAPLLDAIANRRTGAPVPSVTRQVEELHATLWVADLHADSLMWNRDLSRRQRRGLVDLPRLIEGGVALQAFTVVTKVPWGMNVHRNGDRTDMIAWLNAAQRWPLRTWGSRLERALYQAQRLHRAAAESDGRLRVIRSRSELVRFRQEREKNPRIVAGLLGIEGAQALDGHFESLQRLFDAGFRMLAPAHFFDTEVGGSAHGEEKGGLTPLGRRVIREMQRLGMLVDLAHASSATTDDVLSMTESPVVFSHTGVVGTCDSPRNIADEQIRRTAEVGGVIGVGFFESATCGDHLSAVVRAIRYVVDLVGAEYVALGSDFDGFVATPIDAGQMAALTQVLLASGFTEAEVRQVMGENAHRVLLQSLPE